MKLMVGEVLDVVIRVQKILQHYQGSSVITMLDDIYLRCCTSEELKSRDLRTTDSQRPENSVKQFVASKAGKKKPELETEVDFLALNEKLRSIEREEAETLLNVYTVKQLVAFADYMSISVQRSARKGVIVGQISNHFGFRHLNIRMEQRPNMQR